MTSSWDMTRHIDARGGNDLIGLDSGERKDGDGDDSVLVTGTDAKTSVSAKLGAGNDRYVGGPGRDYVNWGGTLLAGVAGLEHHLDWLGSRPTARSGDADEPNRDVVDLGSGDDQPGQRPFPRVPRPSSNLGTDRTA